jgi:hypothetical protein
MSMKLCPRCGSGAPEAAIECQVCGAALGGAPAAPAAPQSPAPAPPPPMPVSAAAAPAATPGLDDFVIPGMESAPAPPAPADVPSYLRADPAPAPPAVPSMPPPAPPVSPAHMAPAGSGPLGTPGPLSGPLGAPEPAPGVPGLSIPPPNYMSGASGGGGMGGGEVRVSLTGEVLEVAPPTPRPTGPSAPGSRTGPGAGPPPRRPAGPGPIPPRPRGSMEYDDEPKKGSPAGIVFLVLLLLMGGGFGGWWWYNNRTNPKDQAKAFYTAFFKDQDWKKVYSLLALSEEDKKKYPNAEAFEKDGVGKLSTNPMAQAGLAQLKNALSDIAVGDATVTDNKADVPTSAKLAIAGQSITMKGTAHMIKDGGAWKFDGTGNEQQSQQAFQDLIGKPEGMGGMMGGMGGGGMGGGRGR